MQMNQSMEKIGKRTSLEGFPLGNHQIFELSCVFNSVSQVFFCVKHVFVTFPQIVFCMKAIYLAFQTFLYKLVKVNLHVSLLVPRKPRGHFQTLWSAPLEKITLFFPKITIFFHKLPSRPLYRDWTLEILCTLVWVCFSPFVSCSNPWWIAQHTPGQAREAYVYVGSASPNWFPVRTFGGSLNTKNVHG